MLKHSEKGRHLSKTSSTSLHDVPKDDPKQTTPPPSQPPQFITSPEDDPSAHDLSAPSPSLSNWMSTQTLPEEGAVEGESTNNRNTPPRGPHSKGNLDSDRENEADLFRVLTVKEYVDYDEGADEGMLSNEEEEEDDFTVHFVHHGKKTQDDTMTLNAPRPELMQQINELQLAVVEMKGSLTDAVARLGSVSDDALFNQKVTETQEKCEANSAEILKLVLGVRTELSSLKRDMTTMTDRQDNLQRTLNILLEDRRILATDLTQAGVISQHTRSRLESHQGLIVPPVNGILGGGGGGSGSGSHSNDSGVALLLERAQSVFAEEAEVAQTNAGHSRASDQDSLPEQPSLLVPSSVYEYVAGLPHQHQPSSSLTSTISSGVGGHYASIGTPYTSTSVTVNENSPLAPANLTVKDVSIMNQLNEREDLGLVYDSDSSLTIAANKTISLSTCLSEEMKVQDAVVSSSSLSKSKCIGRIDSDGSDQSRDLITQPRRRRPLLGISSTAMYHPTHHIHSTAPKDSTHHHRHRHHRSSKGDPRENQRYKIARELLDTEKKYCKTLWTIQDVFAEPLKKAAILSNKDISTLFPEEVFLLYDKHCLLQHQLRERLASWKWHPLIGDILARFTDPRHCEVLRLYTNYVNDFPEVLKTFHKLCRTSNTFTKFIKNCLDQPACGGLDLGAFLLSPVQRVPRYILLMKQLLKYTDSSHPDYRHINACLNRLRDFLARLNDAMEHSFRLVHSSLNSPSSVVPLATTIAACQQNYRSRGRSPRRSESSIGSPTYSPTHLTDDLSLENSEDNRSTHRSLSNVLSGGPSTVFHGRYLQSRAARSSSLPRTSLSSSDSPGVSSGGEGTSQEQSSSSSRIRSRSESATRLRAEGHLPQRPLATARSVSDVVKATVEENTSSTPSSGIWGEDLAASEPSLLDPRGPNQESNLRGTPSLNGAQSERNVANTHKLVTWTDSVGSSDEQRGKKKASIKTSLKNMFTFKKGNRSNLVSRNGRPQEEQLYWSPSSISEGSADLISPPQPSISTTISPLIGDFLDEEGNPCSNV